MARASCVRGMIGGQCGGFVDRLADADVRAAAADIAVHRSVDVLIGGLCIFGEQSRSGHHLPRLAIAALGDIELRPCELDGMGALGGKALDGGDLRAISGSHRRLARAHGPSAEVHGAGAALADAATIFRATKIQNIPKYPEKRHIFGNVDGGRFSVDSEFVGHR